VVCEGIVKFVELAAVAPLAQTYAKVIVAPVVAASGWHESWAVGALALELDEHCQLC
jgi:hypothetical protein